MRKRMREFGKIPTKMPPITNTSQVIFYNGELRQADEVQISPFDHGLLTGDGVFETLVAYDGVPFAAGRHYQRMTHAADVLGLSVPDESELMTAMKKVLEANQLKSARIRVTITGGTSPLSSERGTEGETFLVAVSPVPEYPKAAAVITVPFSRNEKGALAGLKTTSYGENVVAQRIARQQGAHEAIFGNTAGNLCEGSMTNVFVVKNGALSTPPLTCGCLPGVTRALTIELARDAGIGCQEIDSPLSELTHVDEVFLTSTLREIQPVESVNGTAIATPATGICNQLKELFAKHRSTIG